MNTRYGTQNSPTSILKLLHVSTHIIGFHFWKHSASYLRLSLIYCLTHVECFRFFDLAAITAAPKLHTMHDCSTCNDYFVFVIHIAKNRSDI